MYTIIKLQIFLHICSLFQGCDGVVGGRSKLCRTILFRLRAFIETVIRALRFMMISSIYGGLIGFIVLFVEILWKWSLLSCCCCITNKIRGNNDKLPFGFKVYAVATWMVFSHERFQNWPYFIRILDIFLWTIICVTISILGVFYHYSFPASFTNSAIGKILYKIEINGICHEFGMFKMDCYPIEILLIISVLLIILSIIYKLSPSIFVLLQKSKEQKAKDNGYIELQNAAPFKPIQRLPSLSSSYIACNSVIIDKMNEQSYIQEQSSMLNAMNSPNNYLNQQQAMIQTMNEPQQQRRNTMPTPNYIQSQQAMINTMNINHRPNGGNYLNRQQAMIQTMNASTKLYTITTTNAPTHESTAPQQQHAHHTVSATTYSIATTPLYL